MNRRTAKKHKKGTFMETGCLVEGICNPAYGLDWTDLTTLASELKLQCSGGMGASSFSLIVFPGKHRQILVGQVDLLTAKLKLMPQISTFAYKVIDLNKT